MITAQNIKSLRKALGLTQTEMGALVGVAKNTVSAWERGIQRPSFTHACRLVRLAEYAKAK